MERKNASRGFTLVEVVVSTLIVAVGIVVILTAFLSGLVLVESGRSIATAAADARTVLEEMRRVSGNNLGQVAATNWTAWSRTAGLNTLQNEAVTVRFQNPAADPLQTSVTVAWVERNRNRTATFTGLVTHR